MSQAVFGPLYCSGSYLGRALEPEFHYASGDITKLRIYTLSFEEFLEALDQNLYQAWLGLPLPQAEASHPEIYEQLKQAYDQYCRIGGYPKGRRTVSVKNCKNW